MEVTMSEITERIREYLSLQKKMGTIRKLRKVPILVICQTSQRLT